LQPLLADPPLCFANEQTSFMLLLWGLGLFVILPVCCMREIEHLKKASMFGIAALAYASIYIVWSGATHLRSDDEAAEWKVFEASTDIFQAMAMTVSSFSCHLTTIKTYETLGPHRTQGMMMQICIVSLIVAVIFYQFVGVSAYLEFGGGVHGNVLENIAEKHVGSAWMMMANCGLAICLVFSVPVTLWALRDTLIQLSRSVLPSARAVAALDGDSVVSDQPTRTEWIAATTSILIVVMTIATLIPSIKSIMSIGGSVGGAFIVFIFPAAFHLAVVKRVSRETLFQKANAAEISMICIGVGAGLLCLTTSVMGAIKAFSKKGSGHIGHIGHVEYNCSYIL